ncbi:MAG: type I DNA topoisomerase [Clostridia bacterium]|nr:type I DNA topoisomerase [Clostridia bacterium]
MKLVIIEGVGKQDTIKKYLGSEYEVVASKGHVRDLPVKKMGINEKNNFEPQYIIMPDKKDIVTMLKRKAENAEKIYLATDPDREGEAISWHLCHILGLDINDPVRITFNEITKDAIHKGIDNPRGIDMNLVNAQQTRRIIDRLVGYKVSPIVCKNIRPNLSAGRVQSVALRLVVDRENEIRNFIPKEYWTVVAHLFKTSASDMFKSSLVKYKGKKLVPESKEQVDNILNSLNENEYVVSSVKKAQSKVRPTAPFTTSTMQQEALTKLGMTLKKVTSCAQELYEGVKINDEGKVALITYIRTDSVRVAPEAMKMAKDYILDNFGPKYVPSTPNVFKVKGSAQDAHEAIRPISLARTPESVKPYLSSDNYKLYKLIYNKFLASQMAEAINDTVTVEIANGDYTFKSSGKTPVFDGFLAAYNYKPKDAEKEDDNDEENAKLPPLEEGNILHLEKIVPTQKFTKPPSRYTEATLVKEMEDKGIGRPATYTPTITLLTSRKYIEKEGKYLLPSELGEQINTFLMKGYEGLFNVDFTADMETKLDEIASSGYDWIAVVSKFNDYLTRLLGKNNYVEPEKTGIICEKCGSEMVKRVSKYGEFIACSNYPKCKNIINQQKEICPCPKCQDGKVIERRSKKGNIFYGCSNYPKCDYSSWTNPLENKTNEK